MENNNVQKQIEKNQQTNFFFEHVKSVIKNKKENDILKTELKNLKLNLENNNINSLTTSEYELIGVFSFLMGIDYTGQAYLQKNVLENVDKRFAELQISDDERHLYFDIMNLLKNSTKDISDLINSAKESLKNRITLEIKPKTEDILVYKKLKSEINSFLNKLTIPIGLSISVVDFKKNELTYEKILKINSLINEQGEFNGADSKYLINLYSNQKFNELLKKASEYFDDAKYSLIYEESILSVLDSINRFPLTSLVLNIDTLTDEFFEKQKSDYEEKLEKLKSESVSENNSSENKTYDKHYTNAEIEQMMQLHPDDFVMTALEDNLNKYIESEDDLFEAIESIINKEDYVQHIYTYMSANFNSVNRVKGEHYLFTDNIAKIVELLNNKVIEYGTKYKELVEFNCAEIPGNQIGRIVDYVNDCIKACILSTKEQKQYLLSQLIENGITTWNHLQQILSVIETCNIKGEDALCYQNLYDYINDKENIIKVFDNTKEIDNYQIRMSVYRAFREWYKFHLPVETEDKN